MRCLLILNIFILKTAFLLAWKRCGTSFQICKFGQKCFKKSDNIYECQFRCPVGWDCNITNNKETHSNCNCPNGLSCFEVFDNTYKCSMKCLKGWKCNSKSLMLDQIDTFRPVKLKPFSGQHLFQNNPSNKAFVPLVTPEEFINAVKSGGYPEPSPEKFHFLVSQAETAGGIKTKRELAMFLAQILWESDGLKAKREYACIADGCPYSYKSNTDLPGRSYYGRGYIQLTWSGNYKDASQDLFNDDRLLKEPDLVADDEKIAWATAFWYWKTHVGNLPGIERGEFGVATNSINGLLECKGGNIQKAKLRFQLYIKVLKAFKINDAPIESGCY